MITGSALTKYLPSLLCLVVGISFYVLDILSLAMAPDLKFVVVGDWKSGKTCLLMTFTNEEFPADYIPRLDYTRSVR